ncbi:hypothetical protein [Endozoicomonas sp. 8E]|uniref:hypothetical protein n=1 Tax=Endozoicomonas sp. 8E TaxID=3035692 RepID=UPI00293915F9|nr:hypothetical protein [Endozoicomonas sp. 8E]WOG28487.1 hypothetical protein P6910_02190 [Endozoicomonas sp. 8E]
MKNSLSAALLLLLLYSLSVICQAKPLTRSFVVVLERSSGSPDGNFSIKPGQRRLAGKPSYIAQTNSHSGSNRLFNDKPHRLGGYGLKTTLIESISWQLLYVTQLLVAYELILSTNIPSGAKPCLRMPVDAFVAVGWLLKGYWNANSALPNTMDQLGAASMMLQWDDPYAITTMTYLEHGQQKNQQRNQPVVLSTDQQAPGANSQIKGTFNSPGHSGSGGGNEGSEQNRHTLSFNCFVDSCIGVCKLRPPLRNRESAEQSLNFPDSSVCDTLHADPPDFHCEQPHNRENSASTDPDTLNDPPVYIISDLGTLLDPPVYIISDFGTSIDRSVYLPDDVDREMDPSIYLPDDFDTLMDTSTYLPDDFEILVDLSIDPPADFPVTQSICINSTNSQTLLHSINAVTAHTKNDEREDISDK